MIESIIVIVIVLAAAVWVGKILIGSMACKDKKCQCSETCYISKMCNNASERPPRKKTDSR